MNYSIQLGQPGQPGDRFDNGWLRAKTTLQRRVSVWSTRRRLEAAWAWASLLVLIVCWDAALRLDQKVSLPRAANWQTGQLVRWPESD